jgi:predicted RND superfamily exporter protein
MNLRKFTSLLNLLIILAITIAGLIYTQDLIQKNKETIFLTEKGKEKYKKFQIEYREKNIIIVKRKYSSLFPEKLIELKEKVKNECPDLCIILGPDDIPLSFQDLFNLKSQNHLGFIIISSLEDSYIKKLISELKTINFWQDIQMIGAPYTNLLLDEYSKNIKQVLFPALFLGVFLFLYFFLRNLKVAFALFTPCISASSLSLLATKLIYIQSNLVISVVPLIMFVLSLSLAMHIYHTAKETKSFKRALKDKKKPITLMIVTTYIGFSSLYFSELEVISQFGALSSSLILISSVVTINWLYQLDSLQLSIFSADIKEQRISLWSKYFKAAFSCKAIIVTCFSMLILGILIFPRIPVITDATEYFPRSSGLKKSIDDVANTVAGVPILEIVFKNKVDFDITSLKEMNELEKDLDQSLKKINPKIKLLSINQLVKRGNEFYTGTKDIPELQISFATLASKIPKSLRGGYPNFDSSYRITILGKTIDAKKYEELIREVSKTLALSKYRYSLNGLYYHLMTAQKEMISTLFKSFIFSLLIISFITFVTYKNFKLFYIFIIVNIIPICISFIFMKVVGLSLNIATVMTYSISLGMIVDSSFHIIDAIDKSYTNDLFEKTVIQPVVQASSLLAICFASFGFNSFLPIQEFGLYLAFILIIGMIFDLKVLPRLYRWSKP